MSRGSPSTHNCSLFIRNVDSSTKSSDLRKIFEKYGPVKDIYIPSDFFTRQPRGFAYVQFEEYRDAVDAVDGEDGVELNGQRIAVAFAVGDRKTPGQMKRRDTREYHKSYRSRSRSRSHRDRYSSNKYRNRQRSDSYRRKSRSRSYSRSRRYRSPIRNGRYHRDSS